MPTCEYRCKACGHSFSRLVFRGDEAETETCPACGCREAVKAPQAESLFDGISNFSTLARDTN